MRYCDDVLELVSKIKERGKALILHFRGLPWYRKLALLIGRLVQVVGAHSMFRGIDGAAKELKVVRELNHEIYKEWTKAQEQFDNYADYAGLSEKEYVSQSPVPSYAEGKYLEHGMRLLKGFIAVLIGALTSSLAKGIRNEDSRRLLVDRASIRHRDSVSDLCSRIKSKFMEYINYIKDDRRAAPIVQMLKNVIRLASDVVSPTDTSEYVKNIKRLYTAKKDLAMSFVPERLVGDGGKLRLEWLKAGRKIILGLTEALSGYVADSIISRRLCQRQPYGAYGCEL